MHRAANRLGRSPAEALLMYVTLVEALAIGESSWLTPEELQAFTRERLLEVDEDGSVTSREVRAFLKRKDQNRRHQAARRQRASALTGEPAPRPLEGDVSADQRLLSAPSPPSPPSSPPSPPSSPHNSAPPPPSPSSPPSSSPPPTPLPPSGKAGLFPEVEENPMPKSLSDSPEFLAAWAEWQTHLRQKRKTLKPGSLAWRKQLKNCEAWQPLRACAAIEHSISKNYQGLFEDQRSDEAKGQPSQDALNAGAARAAAAIEALEQRRNQKQLTT